MKRKSLRGTGLNGKGQGANALLGGLRSQAQKVSAENIEKLIEQKLAERTETPQQIKTSVQPGHQAQDQFEAEEHPPEKGKSPGKQASTASPNRTLSKTQIKTTHKKTESKAGKLKHKGRLMRTYYIDPDLENDLDKVQAQYKLVEQPVEKSDIVNEALKRYLPQVKEKLKQRLREHLNI